MSPIHPCYHYRVTIKSNPDSPYHIIFVPSQPLPSTLSLPQQPNESHFYYSGKPASRMSFPTPATTSPLPTYLFSAIVNLGTVIGPIPMLSGGKRIVEPITGGTISGPAFNATIEGGLAAPVIVCPSQY